MEGDLGPNVPGSSSAAQLSRELSGTVMSASSAPSPGDTRAHVVPGLALPGLPSPTIRPCLERQRCHS